MGKKYLFLPMITSNRRLRKFLQKNEMWMKSSGYEKRNFCNLSHAYEVQMTTNLSY